MKCAECGTMHRGIDGLMPWPLPGKLLGSIKEHDMLCRSCTEKRREAAEKYKRARHGQ